MSPDPRGGPAGQSPGRGVAHQAEVRSPAPGRHLLAFLGLSEQTSGLFRLAGVRPSPLVAGSGAVLGLPSRCSRALAGWQSGQEVWRTAAIPTSCRDLGPRLFLGSWAGQPLLAHSHSLRYPSNSSPFLTVFIMLRPQHEAAPGHCTSTLATEWFESCRGRAGIWGGSSHWICSQRPVDLVPSPCVD